MEVFETVGIICTFSFWGTGNCSWEVNMWEKKNDHQKKKVLERIAEQVLVGGLLWFGGNSW